MIKSDLINQSSQSNQSNTVNPKNSTTSNSSEYSFWSYFNPLSYLTSSNSPPTNTTSNLAQPNSAPINSDSTDAVNNVPLANNSNNVNSNNPNEVNNTSTATASKNISLENTAKNTKSIENTIENTIESAKIISESTENTSNNSQKTIENVQNAQNIQSDLNFETAERINDISLESPFTETSKIEMLNDEIFTEIEKADAPIIESPKNKMNIDETSKVDVVKSHSDETSSHNTSKLETSKIESCNSEKANFNNSEDKKNAPNITLDHKINELKQKINHEIIELDKISKAMNEASSEASLNATSLNETLTNEVSLNDASLNKTSSITNPKLPVSPPELVINTDNLGITFEDMVNNVSFDYHSAPISPHRLQFNLPSPEVSPIPSSLQSQKTVEPSPFDCLYGIRQMWSNLNQSFSEKTFADVVSEQVEKENRMMEIKREKEIKYKKEYINGFANSNNMFENSHNSFENSNNEVENSTRFSEHSKNFSENSNNFTKNSNGSKKDAATSPHYLIAFPNTFGNVPTADASTQTNNTYFKMSKTQKRRVLRKKRQQMGRNAYTPKI